MQKEQPIKTWRRGLSRSHTKRGEKHQKTEGLEHHPRFSRLCTIWIREKSLNGWLWTSKKSLNCTPNLQLYARTHSRQAYRGCDMRNYILKTTNTNCVASGGCLPCPLNILCTGGCMHVIGWWLYEGGWMLGECSALKAQLSDSIRSFARALGEAKPVLDPPHKALGTLHKKKKVIWFEHKCD